MKLKKILIVDDDPFACDILRKLLADKGYDPVVTYQSRNALAVYKQERPDVVLLDIRMPKQNGLETLEEIKALDPRACVIVVSAVREEATVKKALAMGALDYIKKPVSTHRLEQLLVTIEKFRWKH